MATENKDRNVNTTEKVHHDDSQQRLPHERDESPGSGAAPRGVMQQAASDLENGLVDTDMHGERGQEKVKPAAPDQAQPQPGNDQGQRHATKSKPAA